MFVQNNGRYGGGLFSNMIVMKKRVEVYLIVVVILVITNDDGDQNVAGDGRHGICQKFYTPRFSG